MINNNTIITHLQQLRDIKEYYTEQQQREDWCIEDPMLIDLGEIEQHLNVVAMHMGTIAGRNLTDIHFFEEKKERRE